MLLGKIRAIFGRIRDARSVVWGKARAISSGMRYARFVALLVIAFAIVMYAAPYAVDAAQCTISDAPPRSKCLAAAYNRARKDTNLAAGIIALAVTLAAWRPGRDDQAPANLNHQFLLVTLAAWRPGRDDTE